MYKIGAEYEIPDPYGCMAVRHFMPKNKSTGYDKISSSTVRTNNLYELTLRSITWSRCDAMFKVIYMDSVHRPSSSNITTTPEWGYKRRSTKRDHRVGTIHIFSTWKKKPIEVPKLDFIQTNRTMDKFHTNSLECNILSVRTLQTQSQL